LQAIPCHVSSQWSVRSFRCLTSAITGSQQRTCSHRSRTPFSGMTACTATIIQLMSLLCHHLDSDNMSFEHRSCSLQYPMSHLCGYCALAAAYAVCGGVDLTGRDYDAQEMVDIIDNNIRTGSVDLVPPATRGLAVNLMMQVVGKQHCICHRRQQWRPP